MCNSVGISRAKEDSATLGRSGTEFTYKFIKSFAINPYFLHLNKDIATTLYKSFESLACVIFSSRKVWIFPFIVELGFTHCFYPKINYLSLTLCSTRLSVFDKILCPFLSPSLCFPLAAWFFARHETYLTRTIQMRS